VVRSIEGIRLPRSRSRSADVLLHVTCLRRDGFQTAREGARILCEYPSLSFKDVFATDGDEQFQLPNVQLTPTDLERGEKLNCSA